MKTVLVVFLSLLCITPSFSCENIEKGAYLCSFEDGSVETLLVDYGSNAKGRFIILDSNENKFYINGQPYAENINGKFLNVQAQCEREGSELNVQMNIYGTDTVYETINLSTDSESVGIYLNVEKLGKDKKQAYCNSIDFI